MESKSNHSSRFKVWTWEEQACRGDQHGPTPAFPRSGPQKASPPGRKALRKKGKKGTIEVFIEVTAAVAAADSARLTAAATAKMQNLSCSCLFLYDNEWTPSPFQEENQEDQSRSSKTSTSTNQSQAFTRAQFEIDWVLEVFLKSHRVETLLFLFAHALSLSLSADYSMSLVVPINSVQMWLYPNSKSIDFLTVVKRGDRCWYVIYTDKC